MQGIQTHFRAAWGLQAGVEVEKELAEEDCATSAMGRSQPWSRERQSQRAQGGLTPRGDSTGPLVPAPPRSRSSNARL